MVFRTLPPLLTFGFPLPYLNIDLSSFLHTSNFTHTHRWNVCSCSADVWLPTNRASEWRQKPSLANPLQLVWLWVQMPEASSFSLHNGSAVQLLFCFSSLCWCTAFLIRERLNKWLFLKWIYFLSWWYYLSSCDICKRVTPYSTKLVTCSGAAKGEKRK